jgi:hypothetical protein
MKRGIIIVTAALIATACASREATIRRVAAGLDAAHKAFSVEDERQQLAIVAAAQSEPEARQGVAAHRRQRDKVAAAFQAAYSGLAVAALEPNDLNLARAIELAGAAYAAWTAGKDTP